MSKFKNKLIKFTNSVLRWFLKKSQMTNMTMKMLFIVFE